MRSHSSTVVPTGIRGAALLTGWGPGLASLPRTAQAVREAPPILPLATPVLDSERLRRATRECLLAVAVVDAALQAGQIERHTLAGPRTGLVFASASSYAAANWLYVTGGHEGALHFPYTAPSAVPGEVSIHLGITGPYMTLLSGANAGLEALWQAALLLQTDQCDRVLVLSVETFTECAALFTAGRWLLETPLVETAVCLLLEPQASGRTVCYRAGDVERAQPMLADLVSVPPPGRAYLCMPTARAEHDATQLLQRHAPGMPWHALRARLGTCLACAPLIALMEALAAGHTADILLISRWWETWAALRWPFGPASTLGQREEGRCA